MSAWSRIRNVFRADLNDDIDAELESHYDEALAVGDDSLEAIGVSGTKLRAREATRDAIVATWLESALQDLNYTLRQLRRSPVFTTTAVLTLAIGIGATTAMFSLVQQVMLRPLPVPRPHQLWRIGDAVACCYRTGYAQDNWNFFSWEAYTRIRAHAPGFEEVAAFQVGTAPLGVRPYGSQAAVTTANGEFVSGNFFRTLGVSARHGRLFTDEDDRPGAPATAVLAFHAWQVKYGSDRSIVGATYQINGRPCTIVGIAPPEFFGARPDAGTDFWLPLTTEPLIEGATSRLNDPRTAWLDLIGRGRDGTDPRTLEAQLQVELQAWLARHAPDMTPSERARQSMQTLHVTPGGAGVSLMRETYSEGLRLLMLGALCVLLVACANLANLLLARGLRNRDQTALRAAIGASRSRLMRQAFAESLTLALLGAGVGVVVAYAGTAVFLQLAFLGTNMVAPLNAMPSVPVLLFAVGISIATGIASGTAPSWMASRVDPIDALRAMNRSGGGQNPRAQRALVIAEVAVSVALLSTAAMLGRSVTNLEHQDFGFDVHGRYLATINTMLTGYSQEQLVPVLGQLENRLRAIPGVRAASPVLYAPLSGFSWIHDIRIIGQSALGPNDNVACGWTRVTPSFFETIGSTIVAGRPISDDDQLTGRPVAVINEAFARRFFGNRNPIGEHFGPASPQQASIYEIVGVASNVRYFLDTAGPFTPMYYLPEAQTTRFEEPRLATREAWSHFPYNIVIWAPGHPSALDAQLRKVLTDFGIPIYNIQPYADAVRANFAQQSMIASLTWTFGAIALVLASVGLYGLTAYGVEQRTREIGIRMALGAHRRAVVGMILRSACWQVGTGLALGIPLAIVAGMTMVSWLFGVTPWNPSILSRATLVLGLVALIATLIPARRAAGVDPARALKTD